LPLEHETHHSALGRRVAQRRGWPTNCSGKEILIRQDFIAFEVNEFGSLEVVGKMDTRSFRKRVACLIRHTPAISGSCQGWFDRSGKAWETETPEEALDYLGV